MTRSLDPGFLRSSLARVAVTGAATLAATIAVAPVAIADGAPSPSEPTASEVAAPDAQPSQSPAATEDDGSQQDSTDTAGATESAPPTEDPAPTQDPAPVDDPTPEAQPTVETAPVTPEPFATRRMQTASVSESSEAPVAAAAEAYVDQQITVSVKIASGAYVAEGTSTAGSQFEISYVLDGATTTRSCSTEASTLAGTETFCLFDDGESGQTTAFSVPAGASVTVTQTAAAPGLVINNVNAMSLGPTEEAGLHPLSFENFGPAPTTQPDEVETQQAVPIDIDVVGNDDSIDPETTLSLSEAVPAHGRAELVDVDGKTQIRYTPDEDYSGSDEFKYFLTNANGSTAGTVHVTVSEATGEVSPNYGSQKYRIGVRIADGSYVPDPTTTTVGSTFTITTRTQDGTTTTTQCTTQSIDLGETSTSDTSSICLSDYPFPYNYFGPYDTAPAGAMVTITQTGAGTGLLPQSDPIVIEPCELDDLGAGCPQVDAVFQNTGSIMPIAVDDSATTDSGKAVSIDVLANDTSADPNTKLRIASGPRHGTAQVVGSAAVVGEPGVEGPAGDSGATGQQLLASARTGAARAIPAARVANGGSQAVSYTPARDFSGRDTFTYSLTNGNGSSTATVRVRVKDGRVVEKSDSKDSAGTPKPHSKPAAVAAPAATVLADTGGPSSWLVMLGGFLIACGSAVASRGRRKLKASKVG